MNLGIFAEWLCHQGHLVVQTSSGYWVEVGPHIFQAFPYHWLIKPSSVELQTLFFEHKAVGLRYSTLWDAPEGIASYHVVFERREYPLASLPKKARHDVQRGMKTATIEPISFSRLAEEGWELRLETLQRQGRETAESQSWWQQLCLSADDLPGFETWAAIVEGQLAASLIAVTCDDCCSILYQQSRTGYLSLGVNNALAFVFTNEVLRRPGPPWLFYGLHSLDAPASVDEFKFRMGYTAKPVRQRVVFHPRLAPFFNRASHMLVKGCRAVLPDNPLLAKAEGMMRFYLDGKLPMEQQPHLKSLPICLSEEDRP
ncbi:MAG: hypothetical protein JXB07_19385 [Anaerolineae bacterium]|nr:hypothetical protein [Anaerolineae bacterium]